jgi:hypothetical protein
MLAEPLLVRTTQDVGKLPAGFIYNLPRLTAQLLIGKRLGIAIGSLGVMADLTLTEDECIEAGIA